MTKVTSSSLNAANSGSMISTIEQATEQAQVVASTINAFISSSSGNLKGNGFDAIRNILSFYATAFSKMNVLGESFKESLISNNNAMLNYMEGNDTLNTDDLPSIIAILRSLRAELAAVISTPESHYARIGVSKQALIDSLTSSINYFEHLKKLIEGLEPKDAELFGNLTSVYQSITSFGASAGSIPVGKYLYDTILTIIEDNFEGENEDILKLLMGDINDPNVLRLMYGAFSLLGVIDGTDVSKVRYSSVNRGNVNNNGQLLLDCSSFVAYVYNLAYGESIPTGIVNTGTMNGYGIPIREFKIGEQGFTYNPETGEGTYKVYSSNGESRNVTVPIVTYTDTSGNVHYVSPTISASTTNFRYEYPFENVPENEEPKPGDINVTNQKGHVRIYLGTYNDVDYYIECHNNNNGVQVVTDSGIVPTTSNSASLSDTPNMNSSHYMTYNGESGVYYIDPVTKEKIYLSE